MGMTEAAWRIVVADAGPLIHLDELDSIDLLDFGEVLVPDAVWTEVTRHRPAALASPRVQIPGSPTSSRRPECKP
jgi:predicted nucleic acid-binding protein